MRRFLILALVLAAPLALWETRASAQPMERELELEAQSDVPEPSELAKEVVTQAPDTASRTAVDYNAELLDRILKESTESAIRTQKFAAAAGITGGMILLGLSAWRLLEDEPQNVYTRGLGVMFMTLGMADLTIGVFAATRVPNERRRQSRWNNARKDGITDLELAHFEGELQSASESRRSERMLVRWNGLTHAIGGALVLAFTPIPDGSSQTDRISGYIVGGLFIGTGMAAFATSFRPTPSEKAWTEYNKQKMPLPGHEFSWRLAPSFSRRGAGLSFGGTF